MSSIYRDIEAKKDVILKTWRASFSNDVNGHGASSNKKVNRFTDSVSYLINKGTEDIVVWLASEKDTSEIPETLVDVCRLKAIEEESPSKALAFIFELKQAIWSTLERTGADQDKNVPFHQVEVRIDELMLFAFDRYTEFREQIYHMRVTEIQRGGSFSHRGMAKMQDSREREVV